MKTATTDSKGGWVLNNVVGGFDQELKKNIFVKQWANGGALGNTGIQL